MRRKERLILCWFTLLMALGSSSYALQKSIHWWTVSSPHMVAQLLTKYSFNPLITYNCALSSICTLLSRNWCWVTLVTVAWYKLQATGECSGHAETESKWCKHFGGTSFVEKRVCSWYFHRQSFCHLFQGPRGSRGTTGPSGYPGQPGLPVRSPQWHSLAFSGYA